MMFDVKKTREDFPILNQKVHNKQLVYFDNAATTQKPKQVIDALSDYYLTYNANIHRGIHTLSEKATREYEKTRKKIADFMGVSNSSCVVFTRNATEAINLVAYSWGRKNIEEDDEILITQMEHHSNIVPWQILAEEKRAKIKYIPLTDNGELNLKELDSLLTKKTKIVSLVHVSNVLGTVNPVKDIIKKAHKVKACVLVDGAQSLPHIKVNVDDLDCEFFAFSAHKMLGPTGIGGIYIKEKILKNMPPFLGGGDMIREVTLHKSTWNDIPWKFEAGTPNIADTIAFGSAIDYLQNIGIENIEAYERELGYFALKEIAKIKDVNIYGNASDKVGIISFNMKDIPAHDLGTALDFEGIAIRTGHHCAQPIMERYNLLATARISFYLYNTKEEINMFIEALDKVKQFFHSKI